MEIEIGVILMKNGTIIKLNDKVPLFLFVLFFITISLTACTKENEYDYQNNQEYQYDSNNTKEQNAFLPSEPIPPTPKVFPEIKLYPFEISYFEQVTEAYKMTPDPSSAIGVLPKMLTISGSYTGFQIVYELLEAKVAKENYIDVLIKAGYAVIDVDNVDLDLDLLGLNTGRQADISVYYRNFDNTFVSVAIENETVLLRYATDGNKNIIDKFKNENYDSQLFDSSYYDDVISLYQDDVPNLDVPLGIPPYRIDIEGNHNRLTYYYKIENSVENTDLVYKHFDMTLESAGFKNEGEFYTAGSIKVALELEPERDFSGFTNGVLILTKYDAE
jgi:hypothetical protein